MCDDHKADSTIRWLVLGLIGLFFFSLIMSDYQQAELKKKISTQEMVIQQLKWENNALREQLEKRKE